ncbi:MAG: polysaccharide deacetylase family protein [Clostridia bacterium]|nr:polysaccharide deacetylase family protein [Clostridia bacterium]
MYFALLNKKKFFSSVALFSAGIIAFFALSFSGAYAVFYGGNLRKLPIYYVKTEEKKIAVSFDCAWGVDYTDKLLDIMAAENVRCTFFAVEFWSAKYPEYLKKIAAAGHEIGTHSSTHPFMSKLDKSAIIKELTTSKEIIEKTTGKKVELFRPPYGDYDDLLIETAAELGLYTIQWSVDSLDWKDLSAGEIFSRVVKRVKNGSIVLFHNQGLHTAEALPDIIRELKGKGYEFVPIGELIYRDNFTMGADGAQIQSV